ncbi:hypothetical protein [Afipia felis]|nr:hypothetical protein [Afipia felis]
MGAPTRIRSEACPDGDTTEFKMISAIRNRIYPVIIVVLLLIIAAMAYKFIVAGSTERTQDGRIAIILEPAERDLVLREMRGFVEGLQKITEALSKDDMKGVAKAARPMGTSRARDVPLGIMGKLPLEFKKLAFSTHGGFDTIAMDAETLAMPKHTLGQLSEVLRNCAACHSGYQIKATTPN